MSLRKIFLLLLLLISVAPGLAAPSPWDSWRAGYTNFEQGEALRERGRYSEALEKFEKARRSYLAVRTARPDWNQRVIADRLRDCDRQLADVRRLLGGGGTGEIPAPESRNTVAVKSDTAAGKSPAAAGTPVRIVKVADKKNEEELFKVKAELQQLKQSLTRQRDLESEISALLRDRHVANEKLALLEKRYQALLEEQKSPHSAAVELEKRVLQEKIESERSRRRYEAAEQQLQEVNGKLKEAQLNFNAAEKLFRRAEDELKRKDSELLQLREQLSQMAGGIKQLPGAGSAGKKQNNVQLENLANTLRRANEQISYKDKQLAIAREELLKEQKSARVGAVELANLRERNQHLENDVKLFSEQLTELKKRLERRDSEDFRAAAAANATRSRLEKELLSSQKELVTLRGEVDAGQKKAADSARKIKSLESELISVRSGLMQKNQQIQELAAVQSELQNAKAQLEQLQRDFKALSTENRENRLLAEAARPREKELENAKLRLLEMDRLKSELAREQQLAAELKNVYRKDQAELKLLRAKAGEFDASRRRLVELEAAAGELKRLRDVEKELYRIQGREAELAKLKIAVGDLENSLRRSQAAAAEADRNIGSLKKSVAELKEKNAALAKLKRVNEELKALIANQSSELEQFKTISEQRDTGNPAENSETGKYRALAAKIGALNDQLQQQQSDFARKEEFFTGRISKLAEDISGYKRMLELKDKELAGMKKINAELADYRASSVASLRDKVDLSRVSRLEDELASLNRLNAELAAERDKLIAEVEQKQNGGAAVAVLPEISPEQSASSGVIAESDGNFELAIWNYRQALAADPQFAPAHLRLGTILFNRGSFQEALPHLSAALAADPGNIALAVTVGRCQIKLQRYGNARSVIEPLLARHSNNAVIQMCAALIDAGTGKNSEAEERLHTAIRLAPDSAEIRLELAKLLAASISDRRTEAALVYEEARRLGSAPEPQLEKSLGGLLDHRREVMNFMNSAALEAELSKDWNAAVWYYKKLVAEKHRNFVPRLAFAQWKSGNVSGARETLEFNQPSREGMLVQALILLDAKDDAGAMNAVRQAAGVKIDPAWVGMNREIERLKAQIFQSATVKALLQSISK